MQNQQPHEKLTQAMQECFYDGFSNGFSKGLGVAESILDMLEENHKLSIPYTIEELAVLAKKKIELYKNIKK